MMPSVSNGNDSGNSHLHSPTSRTSPVTSFVDYQQQQRNGDSSAATVVHHVGVVGDGLVAYGQLPPLVPPSANTHNSTAPYNGHTNSLNDSPSDNNNANNSLLSSTIGGGGVGGPSRFLRWQVLGLLCLVLFGCDFCYDMPGSVGAGGGVTIQSHFALGDQQYNQKMNQALYSVYSYPNMFMTIVGGLLIDKYLGLRRTAVLTSSVVVLTSFVFAVGVTTRSYTLMVIARLLFGLTGESLGVCQNAFVSRWFEGSPYMSLAFGIAISFSRLGGGSTYVVSPWVATEYGITATAFTGFAIAFVSWLGCIAVVVVDGKAEANGWIGTATAKLRKLGNNNNSAVAGNTNSKLLLGMMSPSKPSQQQHTTVIDMPTPSAHLNNKHSDGEVYMMGEDVANNHSANGIGAADTNNNGISNNNNSGAGAPRGHSIAFQPSFIPTIPPTLWAIGFSAALCYGATFPFVAIAKTFFERVYDMEAVSASAAAGQFHFIGAVLCPVMGAVVDKTGRSPLWLMVSTSGMMLVYSLFLSAPHVFGANTLMLLLSFFYSVFVASLWSFAPLTVPPAARGFAFGIMGTGVSAGLATSPLIMGPILDRFTFPPGMAPTSSTADGGGDDANGSPHIVLVRRLTSALAANASSAFSNMTTTTLAAGATAAAVLPAGQLGATATTVDPSAAFEILPTEEGFQYALTYLLILVTCGLLSALLMWRVDSRHGGILMAHPHKRGELKAQRDEQLVLEWERIEASNSNRANGGSNNVTRDTHKTK